MRIHALAITALLAPAAALAQPAPAAPPDSPASAPAPAAAPPPSPAISSQAPAEPPASATVSGSAGSPARGWTLAVAPRFGLVAPTSKLGLMVIGGVQVDVATPALDHRLLVGIDWSITRPSHDGSAMDPRIPSAATYSIGETEMVLALLASLRLAGPDKPLVPWVGAGPMLHLLRTSESTSIAPGDNTDVSTELGLELAGGADFRAGPGYLGGDLRIAYSNLDHVLTGNTNAGKLAVSASYRFTF